MVKKTILLISIHGADASLPDARFAEIGKSGDDIDWFENALESAGAMSEIDFHAVKAYEYEPIPKPTDFDAVILGGSYHSVNDRFPWQLDMLRWIEEHRKTGRPMLGVCGGHQLMSQLLGSTVGPLAERPYAGSLPLTLSPAGKRHFLFEGMPDQPIFHFANSEYVEEPPAGAIVLGSAETFEAAAIDYGDQWLSVQFHPEAEHDVLAVDFEYTHPHLIERYHPLPAAPKLLYNFLKGTGMLN